MRTFETGVITMLTLATSYGASQCDGISRRDFIQAGALGLAGLTLPQLLATRAAAASMGQEFVRDKAVVFLFLSGGASQIETFNPNMDGPAPSRSVTGEVKTTLPGVSFGGTFPELAKRASQIAAVRSFRHPVGSHAQAISHLLTGGTDPNGQGKQGVSLGAIFARLRGANVQGSGFPTYGLLTHNHKDGQYRKEVARVGIGSRPGELGARFAPFDPESGKGLLANMKLNLPIEQLNDRRRLLHKLNTMQRTVDAKFDKGDPSEFEQQAVDMLLGSASETLDLSKENPRTVERYDTSGFKTGHKVFQPSMLGRQMLLARRFIEAGAGFVTVHNAGWDMHADSNNPGIAAGMEMLGRPLDKALSAFMDDLKDRGLDRKVLVVITGDFGRTPKVNNRGGRDHWANLSPLAFIGGGLNTGQIIGRAARNNDVPATTPLSTSHLLGTVMHTLFDVGKLRLERSVPRDLLQTIERSQRIEELF